MSSAAQTTGWDQYISSVREPNGWDKAGFSADTIGRTIEAKVKELLPGLPEAERQAMVQQATLRFEAAQYQDYYKTLSVRSAELAATNPAESRECARLAGQYYDSYKSTLNNAKSALQEANAASLKQSLLPAAKELAGKAGPLINAAQIAEAAGSGNTYDTFKTILEVATTAAVTAAVVAAAAYFGMTGLLVFGTAALLGYAAGKGVEYLWKNYLAGALGVDPNDTFNIFSAIDRLYGHNDIDSEDPFIAANTNTDFIAARNWIQRRDPLAIDLDNDGIETVGIQGGSTVLFDHDGDGVKTGTGWVKGDDGFLVLDRNQNGTIDSGSELFGVDTMLANGQKAADGFSALRELDGNGDGKFDAADAFYNTVRVWQDANQDGISQAEELKTLASLGIASIDLNAHNATRNLGNGNMQTLTADVAGVGDAANLDLAQNPFFSEFTDHISLTEQAKTLPSMQGSGMVRNLQEAASLSPTLTIGTALLGSIAKRSDFMSQLDFVLEQWADTSTMKTTIQQGWDVGIGSDLTLTRLDIAFLLPGQDHSLLEGHLGGSSSSLGGVSSGGTSNGVVIPEHKLGSGLIT